MVKTADSQYYTVPEAARLLKVNPSTVWRWIAADKLPAYRVGQRAIRVKKEDLETVLRPARKEAPMSQERPRFEPPTPEEIARRKALVAQILERSEERRIAPMTTTDLVRRVRAERKQAYDRWTR